MSYNRERDRSGDYSRKERSRSPRKTIEKDTKDENKEPRNPSMTGYTEAEKLLLFWRKQSKRELEVPETFTRSRQDWDRRDHNQFFKEESRIPKDSDLPEVDEFGRNIKKPIKSSTHRNANRRPRSSERTTSTRDRSRSRSRSRRDVRSSSRSRRNRSRSNSQSREKKQTGKKADNDVWSHDLFND
jgi:hypothetical protein